MHQKNTIVQIWMPRLSVFGNALGGSDHDNIHNKIYTYFTVINESLSNNEYSLWSQPILPDVSRWAKCILMQTHVLWDNISSYPQYSRYLKPSSWISSRFYCFLRNSKIKLLGYGNIQAIINISCIPKPSRLHLKPQAMLYGSYSYNVSSE